ncbi:MAG: hypothetical protein IJC76_00970 [Lachnospiraceae bacterium]|nr:hypothetical protein [Lachnospiraceae bacterium]
MNKKKLILVILAMIFIVGCDKKGYPDFLIEQEWVYHGEIMEFNKKGEFGCYVSCGNPVGVYEYYDDYIYNYDTGIVTLSSREDGYEDIPMEVIRYDKESMLVKHEGIVKEMHAFEYYTAGVPREVESYVEDYTTYRSVVEVDGNQIITTSSGYTEKKDNEEYVMYTDNLADDVEFYDFSAKVFELLDSIEPEINVKYEKLTDAEVKEKLEKNAMRAYIWYNYDLEIEKVVFYEEHKWKGLDY